MALDFVLSDLILDSETLYYRYFTYIYLRVRVDVPGRRRPIAC
jgi:hypothetical protein